MTHYIQMRHLNCHLNCHANAPNIFKQKKKILLLYDKSLTENFENGSNTGLGSDIQVTLVILV